MKPKKDNESAGRWGKSGKKDISKKSEPKSFSKKEKSIERKPVDKDLIRLNKYLSNAGICSRREADKLIETGSIKVNGKIVTQLGTKININDTVLYGTEKVSLDKPVYILLNKPKDHITTSKDPQNRKTVMHLIKDAGKERVFSVGRLDRNTTGVLLLTNDGDLTKTLTHPKHNVPKIYRVTVDKTVKKSDLDQLLKGVKLDDGTVAVDNASFVQDGKSKKEIGIELHSGKNRVVRRLMEELGYKVLKLDRVFFAGLTKKGLERGKWRFLTDKEVRFLKMQY